ncbi:TIGR02679 family protein [Xanthomonas campestris pv. passiflorae]|uniref:TIGR02679 family protein n=1 Tax=Xanthomonas campestris TaxID=339 RepID=UPI002423D1C0|nr:TIGR02679 family protein [Xanthomonas campestris]MBV6812622.1 TIGR02679 family protein [Xanthomonas campestris pv. passiflorae]
MNPTCMCADATLPPDPRLQRLLGDDALDPLRQRLRRHFERIGPDATASTLRLDGLAPDAHQALCQMTGRPVRPARSITLDIRQLDTALREAGLANSLRDALERLDGPIVDKTRQRLELQARWAAATDSVHACPLLQDWLNTSSAPPLLKRLSRAPENAMPLLNAADSVLRALPARAQPRSQLAANLLGDAHALDAGRPVATLVLAAWRHYERQHPKNHETEEDPEDAPKEEGTEERQRDIWARAGILVNELARPALFLNLPGATSQGALGHPGEPSYISLRQLLRASTIWSVADRVVHVCENPNVLSIAADQLGANCAPLVCTDGMPSAAQRILLDQLHAAGAKLLYHGDFDWPGIGIANFVIRTWNANPWRMSTQDYEAAASSTTRVRHELGAIPVNADWDIHLATAMQNRGTAIAEEAVATILIEDLRIPGPAEN